MPHDSADLTDREAAISWGERCPSAYGICRPGRRSPQRSAHQTPGNYAHGFHVAKVENAPRHGTRFDGCRHCDSNRPSACVRQSRPGCGMGMQPHSVRRCLFSFLEMIARRPHLHAALAESPDCFWPVATYCSAARIWSLTAYSGSRGAAVYCRRRRS
jgi:hypothetical protein